MRSLNRNSTEEISEPEDPIQTRDYVLEPIYQIGSVFGMNWNPTKLRKAETGHCGYNSPTTMIAHRLVGSATFLIIHFNLCTSSLMFIFNMPDLSFRRRKWWILQITSIPTRISCGTSMIVFGQEMIINVKTQKYIYAFSISLKIFFFQTNYWVYYTQ